MNAKSKTLAGIPGLRLRSALGCIALLIWSLGAALPLRAQDAVSEDQVKAAFLYNFARFVEWPAAAFAAESTPINIGVLGSDSFANTLATLLKEKKAHGRAFVVKKLTSASEAGACQIVFIPQSEARRTASIGEVTRRQPILTIGETDEILENGIIYLLKDDKQLRFDINVKNAEEGKLTVSSHLLRLARKTKKD